ncbi:MAG: CotH kinase family protein, partial [Bacteroidia bacterium]|nr:CotH kinase family protein [Bacteroidia bacterium]
MRKGLVTGIVVLLSLFTSKVSAQDTFTSTNLPIVTISTNGQTIVDEPKINATIEIIYNGVGIRNNVTDLPSYSGPMGIEVRGSSSQFFPKKQYGIELWDALGVSIDTSLLGLPKQSDWILFAPYNDKSLLRDPLAYKLGRDLGRYAPRTKFCELVLNGTYQGIYVLMEKIKRDKNRVDIAKLEPIEIANDDLTGGYIIKLDKSTGSGGDGWTSSFAPPGRSGNQSIFFQYDYPKASTIVTQQKEYIKQYVSAFENALSGENFKDPNQGYAKYIDVNSFIDFFIANEVSKNVDGYRLSTFMYKKKDTDGGKLFMGPIWDFNLGFGNADYCTKGNPEGFVINFNSICAKDFWLIPFWWDRLLQDESFRQQLVARWTSLRADKFQTSRIHTYIDSVTTVLNAESQQRNFQKWPVLGKYVWPNYYIGQSFQEEVDWLKTWITQRMAWLDSSLAGLVTEVSGNNLPTDYSIKV